jgi:hypothetical protein
MSQFLIVSRLHILPYRINVEAVRLVNTRNAALAAVAKPRTRAIIRASRFAVFRNLVDSLRSQ